MEACEDNNALVRDDRRFYYKSIPDVGIDPALLAEDMKDSLRSSAVDEEFVASIVPLLWPTHEERINALIDQGYRVVSKDLSVRDPDIQVWILVRGS